MCSEIPHSKGAVSTHISGGTAGFHRLAVLEAQEGLTGKEWPNAPLGTGPETLLITGRDHLQAGSVKDPSRSQWALGRAAWRMEKIKEMFGLPRTLRGSLLCRVAVGSKDSRCPVVP